MIAIGVPAFFFLRRSRVNDWESCANCRSFIRYALSTYSTSYGGWYPCGGKDEWDSLAKCITEEQPEVRVLTSHALALQAEAYWKATESLSEAVCCYRYNEGLRDDDPANVVVAYFKRPTRWECREHYIGVLGRPCLIGGFYWEWKTEADFEKAQAETLAFIRERETRRVGPAKGAKVAP